MEKVHTLKAAIDTVKWGFYDNSWDPVLHINSGDYVDIEALNHQSGDATDYLFDDVIKEIYDYNEGRNMGDHLVTGPIYVENAEPGDVIEMKVIDMQPRMNYGSNVLANWGNLSNYFGHKETVFIYEVDPETQTTYPIFKYLYPRPINAPGLIVDENEITRIPIKEKLAIPLNLHFGVAGVLSKDSGKIHSLHPKNFGGNVDNKNFVKGTSMFFKVQVPGAGVYVGDSHFAQGDGELSGTAIEGSINGRIQLILHKDKKIFKNQILDSGTHWETHGYGYRLDGAIQEAAIEAVNFLAHRYNISKELAYSTLSVKGDFHVTQVANGVNGVHCRILKESFKHLEASSESI
ncbi:acetamidase/formamidase family protein [Erysipelothrix urinaevulpis]|uniref:acetamidase/formamidase family protein n=1 Tax=Erysipelothrix urinaevulpis TaxID=2683717 RepID=UPI00135B1D3B|nr:acetamidase/formamidase family protein [Erysipelothrix urinaevulpis]